MKLAFINPEDAPEGDGIEYLCLVEDEGDQFFYVGSKNFWGWLAVGGLSFVPKLVAPLDVDRAIQPINN